MQFTYFVFFSIALSILSILGKEFSVGSIEYPLFLLFILFSVFICKKDFRILKRYTCLLLFFVTILLTNSLLSKYTDSPLYGVIGGVVTILPFLLFLIAYNYRFTFPQINSYIDMWINLISLFCVIAYLETFVLGSVKLGNALLSISVLKFGFFASLCNQGLILSLYRYSITHKKKYVLVTLFLTFSIFLFVQLKVILGTVLIFLFYFVYITHMSSIKKRIYVCLMIAASVFMILSINVISSKVTRYTNMYGDKSSYENIARTALYYQAINIANDFFPVGTGQGTYGSIPVNMRYSRVYNDYRLSQVGGLGKDSDEDYKMDTHWASILGENGYLGTIIYFMLFLFPLRYLKKAKGLICHRSISFLFVTSLTVITLESTVLSIPTRFCFMFLYAGLNAIICRYITDFNKITK